MRDARSHSYRWNFDWVGVAITVGLIAVFVIALAVSSAPTNVAASSHATPITVAGTTRPTTDLRHSTTTSTTVPSPTTTVPATLTPAQITVEVLNGNGEQDSAAHVATGLRSHGFEIKSTGDADSVDYHRNLIQYPANSLKAAQLVQQNLAGASLLEVDSSLSTNEVLVTVGATNYQA